MVVVPRAGERFGPSHLPGATSKGLTSSVTDQGAICARVAGSTSVEGRDSALANGDEEDARRADSEKAWKSIAGEGASSPRYGVEGADERYSSSSSVRRDEDEYGVSSGGGDGAASKGKASGSGREEREAEDSAGELMKGTGSIPEMKSVFSSDDNCCMDSPSIRVARMVGSSESEGSSSSLSSSINVEQLELGSGADDSR